MTSIADVKAQRIGGVWPWKIKQAIETLVVDERDVLEIAPAGILFKITFGVDKSPIHGRLFCGDGCVHREAEIHNGDVWDWSDNLQSAVNAAILPSVRLEFTAREKANVVLKLERLLPIFVGEKRR